MKLATEEEGQIHKNVFFFFFFQLVGWLRELRYPLKFRIRRSLLIGKYNGCK